MFEFVNKDVAMIASVVILVAVSFYIYKELQKTKKDIDDCRSFSVGLANKLSSPALVNDAPPAKQEKKEDEEKPQE